MSRLAVLLAPLLALLPACGSDTPAPTRSVAPGSDFPLRLISPRVDAPLEPLLHQAPGELDGWLVLTAAGALVPADASRVEVRDAGVRALDPGDALVRFVDIPPGVAFAASVRLQADEPFVAEEPVTAMHVLRLADLDAEARVEDIVAAGTLPGEATTLAARLRAQLRGARDQVQWVAPPDAEGRALARHRLQAEEVRHLRALVVSDGRLRGELRLDRRPSLDRATRAFAAELPPDPDEPWFGPVKLRAEQRLALVVPAGGEHAFDVALPDRPDRLHFGVGPVGGASARDRLAWRVELSAGDGRTWILDEGERALAHPVLLEGFADVSVDWPAEAPSGGDVLLRFAATGDTAVTFGQPLLAGPDRPDVPDILIISIDTLRADHLGWHGYERPTSPLLDAFAAGAVRFVNASTVAPYTLPSHVTLLTGLLPPRHGVLDGGADRLDAHVLDYLPQRLGDAGWHTAAFTGGGFVSAEYGFATGFDRFSTIDPLGRPPGSKGAGGGAPADDGGWDVHERLAGVRRWIDARAGEPWFVLLHTFATHDYRPPAEDLALFDRSPGRTEAEEQELRDLLATKHPLEVPPTQAELDQAIDLYDATIHHADRALGAFLAGLAEDGLLDDAIVVLTSDHGEEFGEHGGLKHSRTLYRELLHVPLLVRAPGGAPREVREPVTLADLAPTVLELAGFGAPDQLDGRSLAPLVLGEGGASKQPMLFANVETQQSRRAALRVGDLKLIEGEQGERVKFPAAAPIELFDVRADPHERHDLSAERPEEVETLLRTLRSMQTYLRSFHDGGGAQTDLEGLSPELLEELRELGYF